MTTEFIRHRDLWIPSPDHQAVSQISGLPVTPAGTKTIGLNRFLSVLGGLDKPRLTLRGVFGECSKTGWHHVGAFASDRGSYDGAHKPNDVISLLRAFIWSRLVGNSVVSCS